MIAVVRVGLVDAIDTATKPTLGKRQRLLRIVEVGVTGATFVEGHDDVRTDDSLDVHDSLGGEEVLRSVDMGAEGHAFVRDLTSVRQAEDLVATAIGEDGAVPAIEAVQASRLVERVETGAQVEVIGIAEDDLRTDIVTQLGHMDGLDRAHGPDGHEDRREDLSVVGLYASGTCGGLRTSLMDIEFQHRCL